MRTLLFILIAFVGITSTLIGMLLIIYPVLNAYAWSVDFLQPTISKGIILPGVLFIITGGANLIALQTMVQRSKTQYNWSLAGGFLTITWVVIHTILLQAILWLYITYFIGGLFIVLLSWQLRGKWAV